MSAKIAHLGVLSWNLFGSPIARNATARMDRVARRVGEEDHDLVLFQEVWTDGQAQAIAAVLSKQYEIKLSAPARPMVGRQGGLMALVRKDSSWLCTASDFQEFQNEAPDILIWQGDGVADKGVQRLKLAHRESDLELLVLNTHLQSDYGPRALFTYEAVREAQLGEMEALAREDEALPMLAFGDFNLTPSSENYRRLRAFWTVELSKATREACGCGTHDGGVGGAADWIDYALARPNEGWGIAADVTRIEREDAGGMLSDHNGLAASIRIERRHQAGLHALATAALVGPSTRRAWLAGAAYFCTRFILRRFGP